MPTLTTQQQLDEARSSYHLLNTGRMAEVLVDQNGEQVRFTRATASGLLAYIQRLEQQITDGTTSLPLPKAISVFF